MAGREKRTWTAGGLTAFSALFAVMAGWALYMEMASLALGASGHARMAALSQGLLRPGLSIASQTSVLEACHAYIADLPDQMKADRSVVRLCLSTAGVIAAGTPSHAYGWYIIALSAGELGIFDLRDEALERSRMADPTGQRLARLRADLMQHQFALRPGQSPTHAELGDEADGIGSQRNQGRGAS